jgi:nucleoside-diphosphate-sugar epimerase
MKSDQRLNLRGNRILVTGASGFVGQALLRTLAEDGHLVRAMRRRNLQFRVPARVDAIHYADFSKTPEWEPILEGIDKIIHLAGVAHLGRGMPVQHYDTVNRLATLRLAEAAARANIERFVYVSSIRAQSGAFSDHILTEADAPTPTDAYGRSKLAAENAVMSAGIPFTIVRPVVIYGPGMRGNMSWFIRAVGSSCPLPFKSFTNRRSFLGLQNLISALKFVMSAPTTAGQTYIIADPGPALPMYELVTEVRRMIGRSLRLIPLPPSSAEFVFRITGRRDLWERLGANLEANPTKLIGAGWTPVHDTITGLATTAEAMDGAGGAWNCQ